MLYQAHWQFMDGTTKMCSQFEVATNKGLRDELEKVRDEYPLPEGAIWMWCDSSSSDFVLAAE